MKKMMFAVVASFITVAAWAQQAETPDTQVKDIASGKKVAFNQCFEKGKVTAQLGKVFELLNSLGLELHIIKRGDS